MASTSTSTGKATLASAWSPYAILPGATRRRVSKEEATGPLPLLEVMNLSRPHSVAADATERLRNAVLHLLPPEGKVSESRKKELAKRAAERQKKRALQAQEGSCGLVGRRKRAANSPIAIRYDAVLSIHRLWLSYIAELLALPILVDPVPTTSTPLLPTNSTSTLLPTFPPRHPEPGIPTAADFNINVNSAQTKLLKAEFVGCLLTVKRAKNPSLVGLAGIVLQETQGTFKIVNSKSAIKVLPKKNSVFTTTLPLVVPASARNETSRQVSFDIYGDAFGYRGPDRVGRKWKAGGGSGGVELM